MLFFDEFNNKYIVNAKIENVSPFHIGISGSSLSPIDPNKAVIKDAGGYPIIPGSSIKGIFRATLESLLSSYSNIKVCDFGRKPCIDLNQRNEILSDNNENSLKKWYKYIEENICEICSIFGSNSTSSHIFFSDFQIEKGSEFFTSIRDGIRIDRDTETTADTKFDFEVVNPGNKFEGEIILENVEKYQLGFILKIIELINDGFIRIGGKKSAGLGKIKIEYSILEINRENVFNNEKKEISEEDIENIMNQTYKYLKEKEVIK